MADNYNPLLYARGYGARTYSRSPSTPPPQPTTCAPACADCGLLECLCRPRFFAGQLLTEQDLNRLDSYIRAKNRMHNLQLHGWGVVNGLQVRCDSCGSGVIVGTGYAIDPCGEDIVVCGDIPVDICALIKRCQPADITCRPSTNAAGMNANTCDDVEEDWVLAIRYTETQARAVTALRSTPSCACGAASCSCGGSSCGCGNKAMMSTAPTNAMTTPTTQKPRSAPPECEATAICEGYSFDAFLAPTTLTRADPKQLSGPLIDAVRCCIEPLAAALPPIATGTPATNPQGWYLFCCRTRQALIGFFSSGPQANCTLVEKLNGLVCPQPNDPNFQAKLDQALKELVVLLFEALLSCLCSALLPPAPCGTSDDRVPLAIVTVRKKDCKILRVCNWTHLRKLVLTFPTFEYWLGWIPWLSSLQDAIAAFCCADITVPQRDPATPGTLSSAPAGDDAAMMMANPTLDAQKTADNQTMTTLIMNAFARGNTPIDANAIVNAVFGFKNATTQPLTDAEKANIAPFLLLNEVLRPVLTSLVPSAFAGEQPLEVTEKVSVGGDTEASLYERVAKLERAIEELGGNHP